MSGIAMKSMNRDLEVKVNNETNARGIKQKSNCIKNMGNCCCCSKELCMRESKECLENTWTCLMDPDQNTRAANDGGSCTCMVATIGCAIMGGAIGTTTGSSLSVIAETWVLGGAVVGCGLGTGIDCCPD